jgi:hypothetical protein
VNRFINTFPIAFILTSAALGQAGAEGQYDLLFPTEAASTQSATPVVRQVAFAKPVADTRMPVSVTAAAAPKPAYAIAAAAPAPTVGITTPVGAPSQAKSRNKGAGKSGKGMIGDYDFGEVVQTLQTSVQPLEGQINNGFPKFVGQLDDAIVLMEDGKTKEAVAMSAQAVDGVLLARDSIVDPLWEAQFYLNAQIADVRNRLATSLTTNNPTSTAGKADTESNKMLDTIASRISKTQDPARKKKLVAHYRTIRTLASVRKASVQMTPDQRKLWFSVLKVLDQASAAHQQVLLGSETLFAQLDGTATQLRDYLGLLQTVEGVDALLGSVEGGGMEGFVEGMRLMQTQMETFSQSMEGALQGSMAELESRVDSMQNLETKGDSVVAPSTIDDELQTRMDRMAPNSAGKE